MTTTVAPETEAPTRFVFGGVAFDLCAERGLSPRLSARARALCAAPGAEAVSGVVGLSVAVAPELGGDARDGRRVDWRWNGPRAELETALARGELRALGARRFAGRALVAADGHGLESALLAIAAAVSERSGGLVLHAAAVRFAEQAVLFVGPSGAGKSTAALQTEGGAALAFDRACVFERGGRWYAAGLPGGDPSGLRLTPAAALPLGGVFRVVQGRQTGSRPLRGADALVAVRESALGRPSEAATAILERGAKLAASGRVFELTTVLGEPVGPSLAVALGGLGG